MQLITDQSALSSPRIEHSVAVRSGDRSAAAQTPPAAMKSRRKGLHEGRGERRETSQAPEGPAEMQEEGYSGISLRIKTSTQPPNELEGVSVIKVHHHVRRPPSGAPDSTSGWDRVLTRPHSSLLSVARL